MNQWLYKDTFREGITIKDLKPNDTIYISKIVSGYQVFYECSFIKFEKGIVTTKYLNVEHNWVRKTQYENHIITAKPTSCFLWGRDDKDSYQKCHWFNKKGECN